MHCQRGFTLIEVLVALTLLSLLAIGVLSTLRITQSIESRTRVLERSVQDVVVTPQFLRGAIGMAYPTLSGGEAVGIDVGLKGDDRELLVLTTVGRGASYPGLQRLQIRLEPASKTGESVLVAYVSPDLGGDFSEPPRRSREVLLTGVKSAEWSYQGGGREDSWARTWSAPRLPRLVRLRLRFAGAKARPWPELIMATRITNDANCEFDVVSQGCRGQAHQWLP
jgi:general secretion pathway protein J